MILKEKDSSYSAIPLLFDEEKKILKSLGRNGRPFPGCFVKKGGREPNLCRGQKKGVLQIPLTRGFMFRKATHLHLPDEKFISRSSYG